MTLKKFEFFVDSLSRIWEVKNAWDANRTQYLIGLTKDTPTFTTEQLRGISIVGFRKLEEGEELYVKALRFKKHSQRLDARGT